MCECMYIYGFEYICAYHCKEMDSMNQFQSLDEAVCISLWANALGKGINLSLLPPAMGKIVGLTGLFSLDKATSLGGKSLNSNP